MGLTTGAIIVLVLVGCLAVTALGASLFRHYTPIEEEARYSASYEQGKYMRTVRLRNHNHLRQESLNAAKAKDLESQYSTDQASSHYNPHTQPASSTPQA
ncbi:uncharacterized protein N7482_000953 [Penicillium canariense]|uniref:Secreted protein n=1 Tax=Penicillium canariense TaxID=189055 RepID=A0A9W9IIW0_9EURO|nr:uncharacterized protein N7482_000953 [Penicillium canariense]KAJ5175076.1 hypothetical protein N7482_000953 [Penicillium canariense]